ncbi:hypothetical protein ACJX0J_039003, partial [Zea mays]
MEYGDAAGEQESAGNDGRKEPTALRTGQVKNGFGTLGNRLSFFDTIFSQVLADLVLSTLILFVTNNNYL